MERWSGRVAVVTGAGSGIGAGITEALVKHGMNVVGVDFKNHSRIEDMRENLSNSPGKLYALKVDVSKEDEVAAAFDWIRKNLLGVDILVNCAGVYFHSDLTDVKTEELYKMYDINVIGFAIFIKEAVKSMKERGVDDGHIINIDSITGHFPPISSSTSVYASTKHAIKVLSEGLRRELVQQKSKIRVTNLSPGVVQTELVVHIMPPTMYENIPKMYPEDIANGVIFALSAPPHVQVHELTIRAVGETYP